MDIGFPQEEVWPHENECLTSLIIREMQASMARSIPSGIHHTDYGGRYQKDQSTHRWQRCGGAKIVRHRWWVHFGKNFIRFWLRVGQHSFSAPSAPSTVFPGSLVHVLSGEPNAPWGSVWSLEAQQWVGNPRQICRSNSSRGNCTGP